MARILVAAAAAFALVAPAAPGQQAQLLGGTPSIRGMATHPVSGRPGEVVIAELIEARKGSFHVRVRALDRKSGMTRGTPLLIPMPDGMCPSDPMFSHFFRPGSLMVLDLDGTVFAWDIAYDADGLPKLVGTTPAILPIGPSLEVPPVACLSIAEAPNVTDPGLPFLGIGTATGELLVATSGGVAEIIVISGCPLVDLATVPQVGTFVFVAAIPDVGLVGVAPSTNPDDGSPLASVIFELADPRPHPFFDIDAFIVPGPHALDTPTPISIVAANGTNEVAVLTIPANPGFGDLLEMAHTSQLWIEIGAVSLGSLAMLTADGSAILYDPAFTPEGGFGGGILTISGADLDLSPDTLNVKSRGKPVTAVIEVADGGALQIDPTSVALRCRSASVPATTIVGPGDEDLDGNPDLTVKFDRSAVIRLVGADRGRVTLEAVWHDRDGTPGHAFGILRVTH